ncbi:MAG: PadR family transcriptional regulator [Gemmatimonadota bacterium]|jgi:PadR family transcriptional regulator PadR
MGSDGLQILKGTLELLVLKTLARNEELHGFEILDWIERESGKALQIEEGALYPALHRMEKRGWLASAWGVSEKGRRAKYYRLTPEGRQAHEDETRTWSRYVNAVASLDVGPEGVGG